MSALIRNMRRRAAVLRCAFAAVILAVAPGAWASVSIAWTGPANGSTYTAPATIPLSTSTSTGQGYTLSKVEFFSGSTLIATINSPNPFTQHVDWTNVPGGTYSVYAKATAVKNNAPDHTATTTPVQILVNAPPVVSMTSPANDTTFLDIPPPTIRLEAQASDSDGSITTVEFGTRDCNGVESSLATLTAAPYTLDWTIPPPYYYSEDKPQCYTVWAVATDNQGAQTRSNEKYFYLNVGVQLTSPANGANYAAPASIPLQVAITPPDYPTGKVQYYNGTTLIGESTTAPYSFTWANVPAGTYSLTAILISASGNADFQSSPVNVTVTAAAALYLIHVDHLNTPREVYDATQQLRWKWDQAEPFGVNAPDENPSALGTFEFALRFPGQYADKETNLAYNWHRDYDSSVGRYVESDLIGLMAGPNTYAYVESDTLGSVDTLGLAGNSVVLNNNTLVCRGGLCTAGNFIAGSGVSVNANGLLQNVSVVSANSTSLAQLSCKIPNGQIGVTTVGQVVALGGTVVPSPTRSNPYHATLSGITPAQAQALFTPTIKNPARVTSGKVIGGIGGITAVLPFLAIPSCRQGNFGNCFCSLNADMLGQNPAQACSPNDI